MSELAWSQHAREMAAEWQISEGWVARAIQSPDRSESREDGHVHYLKAIQEHEGRFLRVVVNRKVTPHRIVTVFFDRRVRRDPDEAED